MIRRLLVIVVLACSCSTWAASDSFTLKFDKIPFVELVRVLYVELLGVPFVLDSSFLAVEDRVSVDLVGSPGAIESAVMSLLEEKGFSVATSAGIRIVKKKPGVADAIKFDDMQLFFYRPKFRSLNYLSEYIRAVLGRQLMEGGPRIPASVATSGFTSSGGGAGMVQPANGSSNMFAPSSSAISHVQSTQLDVIVARVTEKERDIVTGLLSSLDVPTPEVQLKAVVFEVQKEFTGASGVNLALSLLGKSFGFSVKSGAAADRSVTVKIGDFEAAVSALESDSRFKVVTAPYVRVQSGEAARFVVGTETPVLTGIVEHSSASTRQSIEYKSSGVIFEVTAGVRENVTDLQVFQQISNFVETKNGVNQSPTLLKRELRSKVSSSSSEVVLIGGLDEDREAESDSGLAFLPRSWWGQSKNSRNTQMLLMLHVERI